MDSGLSFDQITLYDGRTTISAGNDTNLADCGLRNGDSLSLAPPRLKRSSKDHSRRKSRPGTPTPSTASTDHSESESTMNVSRSESRKKSRTCTPEEKKAKPDEDSQSHDSPAPLRKARSSKVEVKERFLENSPTPPKNGRSKGGSSKIIQKFQELFSEKGREKLKAINNCNKEDPWIKIHDILVHTPAVSKLMPSGFDPLEPQNQKAICFIAQTIKDSPELRHLMELSVDEKRVRPRDIGGLTRKVISGQKSPRKNTNKTEILDYHLQIEGSEIQLDRSFEPFSVYLIQVHNRRTNEGWQIRRRWSQLLDFIVNIKRRVPSEYKDQVPGIPTNPAWWCSAVSARAQRLNILQNFFDQLWLFLPPVATLVNSSLILWLTPRYDAFQTELSNPEKEGHVWKESPVSKEWKKMYLVLKGSTLYFFSSKKKTLTKPAIVLNLSESHIREASERQRPFCFTISHKTTSWVPVFVSTENDQELRSWLNFLKIICRSHKTKTGKKSKKKSEYRKSDRPLHKERSISSEPYPQRIKDTTSVAELKAFGPDHPLYIPDFPAAGPDRPPSRNKLQVSQTGSSSTLRVSSSSISGPRSLTQSRNSGAHSAQDEPTRSSFHVGSDLSVLQNQATMFEKLVELKEKLDKDLFEWQTETASGFLTQSEGLNSFAIVQELSGITNKIISCEPKDFIHDKKKASDFLKEIKTVLERNRNPQTSILLKQPAAQLLAIYHKFCQYVEFLYLVQVQPFCLPQLRTETSKSELPKLSTSDEWNLTSPEQTAITPPVPPNGAPSHPIDGIPDETNDKKEPVPALLLSGADVKQPVEHPKLTIIQATEPSSRCTKTPTPKDPLSSGEGTPNWERSPSPSSGAQTERSGLKRSSRSPGGSNDRLDRRDSNSHTKSRGRQKHRSSDDLQSPSRLSLTKSFDPLQPLSEMDPHPKKIRETMTLNNALANVTPPKLVKGSPLSCSMTAFPYLREERENKFEKDTCRICDQEIPSSQLREHNSICKVISTVNLEDADLNCECRMYKVIEFCQAYRKKRKNAPEWVIVLLSDLERLAAKVAELKVIDRNPDSTRQCKAWVDTAVLTLTNHMEIVPIQMFGRKFVELMSEKYASMVEYDSVDFITNPDQVFIQSRPMNLSTLNIPSIEDYKIIKPLSKGGYGRVYLATKKTTGDLYAIKVMKKDDIFRKNMESAVVAEREAMTRAKHPFVVNLEFSFQSKDYFYLVMEYLIGGDLGSMLEGGPLSEPLAKHYVSEIVLSLEYLHSIGIVHRDLKPENILISDTGHLKLIDFGLSQVGALRPTNENSTPESDPLRDISAEPFGTNTDKGYSNPQPQKKTSQLLGTPNYLSPEAIEHLEYGEAGDWWALGVMTYEFIVGSQPFCGSTPSEIFWNITSGIETVFWPPSGDEYFVQPDCKSFIIRLLDSSPKTRLGSNGVQEIKDHPWLRDQVWDNLYQSNPNLWVPNPNIQYNNERSDGRKDSFWEGKDAIAGLTVHEDEQDTACVKEFRVYRDIDALAAKNEKTVRTRFLKDRKRSTSSSQLRTPTRKPPC